MAQSTTASTTSSAPAGLLVGASTWGVAAGLLVVLALLPPQFASAAGPAIASVMIYLVMAVILFFKPQGLFPARA